MSGSGKDVPGSIMKIGDTMILWGPHFFLPLVVWSYVYMKLIVKKKRNKTSITPSCRGPIPAQKSRGNSVLGVVFFQHDAKNGFSLFSSF